MSDALNRLPDSQRRGLREEPLPPWKEPMLATLTDETFSSTDWLFERKLDGERCLVFHGDSGVQLLSRNQKALNDKYPELVDAIAAVGDGKAFVADGEIVAFEGKVTSFSRLQERMQLRDPEEIRTSPVKVYLYLFDLLHLDGHDLTALALRERKRLLRHALRFRDPIRFLPHRNEKGETFHREACQKGWEGLIAKRAQGRYRHGRTREWLKLKCVNQQELVIGGYTDPKGSRSGFGALLVGYYEGDSLRYAGKVGTGFDERTLEELYQRLKAIERSGCPFAEQPNGAGRTWHWVSPTLVAEIGFTEWTHEGHLRHPRYLGLRDDKAPRDVVREEPS